MTDINSELTDAKLIAEVKLLELQSSKEAFEVEGLRLRNIIAERDVNRTLSSPVSARTYTFWDTITDKYIANAVVEIGSWVRQDPGCDITIVLNSPGGSVFDGLAFHDFLRDLSRQGNKIITKGMGMVASIAVILFTAGDERIVTPNTYFMLHDVAKHFPAGGSLSASFLRDEQKFLEDINTRLVNIVASRSKLTSEDILQKVGYKEWWFDATEAVELGIADRVEV